MQMPVIHDRLAGTKDVENLPGVPLSIKSQLKLRALYEFVELCRSSLDEIERDLLPIEFGPASLIRLRKVSERLGRFGIEADSWGFDSIYEIAHGLQLLLLNSGGSVQSAECWEALQRGLKMLEDLIQHCEPDFCMRLAVADVLECLEQATSR
jgi:hypothetical protein